VPTSFVCRCRYQRRDVSFEVKGRANCTHNVDPAQVESLGDPRVPDGLHRGTAWPPGRLAMICAATAPKSDRGPGCVVSRRAALGIEWRAGDLRGVHLAYRTHLTASGSALAAGQSLPLPKSCRPVYNRGVILVLKGGSDSARFGVATLGQGGDRQAGPWMVKRKEARSTWPTSHAQPAFAVQRRWM
jgi:hypothetical protein